MTSLSTSDWTGPRRITELAVIEAVTPRIPRSADGSSRWARGLHLLVALLPRDPCVAVVTNVRGNPPHSVTNMVSKVADHIARQFSVDSVKGCASSGATLPPLLQPHRCLRQPASAGPASDARHDVLPSPASFTRGLMRLGFAPIQGCACTAPVYKGSQYRYTMFLGRGNEMLPWFTIIELSDKLLQGPLSTRCSSRR
jgi:hypothetical protein